MSTFEGLTDEDFDNYLPPRWSSNLHNLGRMKTKARVLALGEALADAIGREGLTVEASSEIPSVWNGREVRDQWAYLMRDGQTRKALGPVVAANMDLATRIKDPAEFHRHALMCVHLDHERLEVGLRINQHATVDLANLLGRADAELGRLQQALADLPEDVTLGGEPVTIPALKAAAHAARAGESDWLIVSRTFPRDAAIAAGEDIKAAVEETARLLEPLFRFVLWTPENDHVGAASQIEAFAEAVEAREQEAEARKAAADAARTAREEQARARTSAKVAAEEAWRQMQADKRRKIAAAKAAEDAARKAADEAQRIAREAAAHAQRAADEAAAPADAPSAEALAEEAPEKVEKAPEKAEKAPEKAEKAPEKAETPARKPDARPARSGPPREGRGKPRGDRPGRGKPSGKAPRQGGPSSDARGRGGDRPARGRPDRGPAKERPAQGERPGKPQGKGPQGPSKPAPKAAAHTFAAGDACRLTRGLFAGKQGVIKGAGKAGYYKVKVGPLEVSVSAHEIEPLG